MEKHSKMYEKIRGWYHTPGGWTKKMVHDAVKKKRITAEEYLEITGETYTES